MEHHLNPGIMNNCSEEEKQKYKTLYEDFCKKVEELNNSSKELEQSKRDLNFWYNEQKCAKSNVGKNYPISIRTLKEKREYYSPAMDIWGSDGLPSRATLNFAMSLYYKVLIKYGEKFHKNLKTKHANINKELNKLAQDFKEFEHFLNEKHKFMWFPVKITLDDQIVATHSIKVDKDGKIVAFIDVNPHNKCQLYVSSLLGLNILFNKDQCLSIETFQEEKLFEFAKTEGYKNTLKEYAKLYESR